jgi:hypothetical protein
MYAAQIKNVGYGPVSVRVCDAMTDGMEREVTVAYAVERWDRGSNRWTPFWRTADREFCRPTPTGIFEGQIRDAQLEPGQIIPTAEVAVQAMTEIRRGDRLRFIVFPYWNDTQEYLSSAGFEVDESPIGYGESETSPVLRVLAQIWLVVVITALALGWVRWVKDRQASSPASILSLLGLTLASLSGVLATYAHFATGFSGYDWWALCIFRWGALISACGILLALGGVWRSGVLRWYAPTCAVGVSLSWLAAVITRF